MSLISASGVGARYGETTVVQNVDFSIEPGEIVTVVGPNGSGKSTLVRMLAGIQPVSMGKVTRKKGLRIGYVPQQLHLAPSLPMTVRRFLDLPRPVTDGQASETLGRVGASGLEERQLGGLSGGQFQRVLLARALLNAPDILVLDEPTQALDQPGIARFYQLLQAVRDELGLAVLLVSHDLHVVMSASDRVICLNGHVCCQGAPHVVSNAPEYRALFGQGTGGALALYQHAHDHSHEGDACAHDEHHAHAGDVHSNV